ncbi:ornithine carbamoyltransferase [Mycoplasma mycoides subsp. capri]|nr:ornithine carbamoyltransferase [Mycoplasma mycoides subsp. capri]
MGMHFVGAAPKQLWPSQDLIDQSKEIAKETNAIISFTEDMKQACSDADVIYTDVWVSMGEPAEVWESRINLLKPYQVNMDAIKVAKPDVIFMHCLPSFHDLNTEIGRQIYEKFNIPEMEVTNEVFESKHSVVFEQAENRLHTIKAVMVATIGK